MATHKRKCLRISSLILASLLSCGVLRPLHRNKYLIVANRELRGLGFANLAGSMFHCYTTTGSFSRSAVNDAVGAKTRALPSDSPCQI